MIDQQSRLVDMSKWGEPQSEIAQQLISAMLQVRDIIEDPQNFQQRSNFGYSKRETIWSMPIVLHPDDSMEPGISQPLLRDISLKLVRVDIQGDDRDPTKRLRMTIGTLLSLWLRLINKRTRQLDWRLDSPSALQRVEGMEREMRMTPKSVFVRIVAFESTGDENERGKLELLARWLDTRIYRVPSPTGTTRLGRTGGVFGLESESPSSWEHLVYHHPVFGLPFSSFQRYLSCYIF
ncbi:hypothetical protein BKA64DRAFT_120920 [Cadophora sp. MPI-SDFR-AT-0126]|nr:hypothetical protein BKA64DRAFT_120920 [Leotiomycetes sp. MPI-SDFR-AT-0126]